MATEQQWPTRAWKAAATLFGQGAHLGPTAPLTSPSGWHGTVESGAAHVAEGARMPMGAAMSLKLPDSSEWEVTNLKEVDDGEHGVVFKGTVGADPDPDASHKVVFVGKKEGVHFVKLLREHPEILTLYKPAGTDGLALGQEVFLVLQPVAGTVGDLVMGKPMGKVSLQTRLRLFHDVVKAAKLVAERDDVYSTYREVWPESVLILGDVRSPTTCRAVLCDLGNTCSFDQQRQVEVRRTGPSFDMRSLGLTLYALLAQPGARLNLAALYTGVEIPNVKKYPSFRKVHELDPLFSASIVKLMSANCTWPCVFSIAETLSTHVSIEDEDEPRPPFSEWSSDAEWEPFFRQLLTGSYVGQPDSGIKRQTIVKENVKEAEVEAAA